jgi:hypothetical protein
MLNRLPSAKDIIPVYAIVAFLIQMWTISVFIKQLATFSSFLSLNEVLAIFAYRIAESFLECLLVVGILITVAFLLPPKFFRDAFAVRGSAFAVVLLGSVIVFWQRFATDPGVLMADYIRIWTMCTLLFACLVSYVSTKSRALSAFLDWVSDRMIVFLYVLLPLSVASLILVLIRNIV